MTLTRSEVFEDVIFVTVGEKRPGSGFTKFEPGVTYVKDDAGSPYGLAIILGLLQHRVVNLRIYGTFTTLDDPRQSP